VIIFSEGLHPSLRDHSLSGLSNFPKALQGRHPLAKGAALRYHKTDAFQFASDQHVHHKQNQAY
jgi:hypothetical protein